MSAHHGPNPTAALYHLPRPATGRTQSERERKQFGKRYKQYRSRRGWAEQYLSCTNKGAVP